MRTWGAIITILSTIYFYYVVSKLMHREPPQGVDPPEPMRSRLQEYAREYPIKENE